MAAIQGATSTSLTNVLKNLYVEPLVDQLNNEILVNQILDVSSENFEGLKVFLALHTSRSAGIGSRLEGDDLPDAGVQKYGQLSYDMASHYARVGVSGQAIMRSKTPSGAFVRAFDEELKRIKDDVALDFARQTYGTGDGVIATIPTGVASATQTLATSEALDKGFIYIGMTLDVGTTANPTASASAAVVTDVDIANKQVVFSASFTSVNGDKISRAGNNKAAGTKEMDAGMQKLISTSANSVGGLDASIAGNRFWDNLRANVGGAVALGGTTGLLLNWNKVSGAGAKPSEIVTLTTPGITRSLFEANGTQDFQNKIRYNDTVELNGGFERISFQGGSGKLYLYPDRLAPYGNLYFIHKSHIRLFSPNDWDFLARDGQPIKWQQNKDAWQAILYRYANLGTDRRNSSMVLYGITDTGY